MNDAVSILIFETIQNVFGKSGDGGQGGQRVTSKDIGLAILHFVYLSAASIGIGIIIGMLSAILTKRMSSLK